MAIFAKCVRRRLPDSPRILQSPVGADQALSRLLHTELCQAFLRPAFLLRRITSGLPVNPEVAKTMRLGFYDLNVVTGFRIKRIPLRSLAIGEELTALFVMILIQFMNLENRARDDLAVVRVEKLKPVNDPLVSRSMRPR